MKQNLNENWVNVISIKRCSKTDINVLKTSENSRFFFFLFHLSKNYCVMLNEWENFCAELQKVSWVCVCVCLLNDAWYLIRPNVWENSLPVHEIHFECICYTTQFSMDVCARISYKLCRTFSSFNSIFLLSTLRKCNCALKMFTSTAKVMKDKNERTYIEMMATHL